MAFKFVTFALLVAAANAGLLPTTQLVQQQLVAPQQILTHQVAQPLIAKQLITKQVEEYDPNPQYSYGYDVQDSLTGDSKSQQETRSGDVVQGQYSLIEPDGVRRTVNYVADPINGFNAVVSREPVVAKTLVKSAVVAQPTLVKNVVAQPLLAQQLHQPLIAQQLHQPIAFAQPTYLRQQVALGHSSLGLVPQQALLNAHY